MDAFEFRQDNYEKYCEIMRNIYCVNRLKWYEL